MNRRQAGGSKTAISLIEQLAGSEGERVTVSDQSIRSYRDLRVWQMAMELAEDAYRLTNTFPKEELFGLTSQIRRAATSIAANIAEGYGRQNIGSYLQFLRIAQGSLKELETHLILSERIGLCAADTAASALQRCDDTGRMLRSLIQSLVRHRGGAER